jgi:hypothetical protein
MLEHVAHPRALVFGEATHEPPRLTVGTSVLTETGKGLEQLFDELVAEAN